MSEPSADAPLTPRWRRRRVILIATVVVIVVAGAVTGVLVATSSSDDTSSTPVGAQFAAPISVTPTSPVTTVHLPGGTLALTVDRSPREQPEDSRDKTVPAPDGGRFVVVRWRGEPSPATQVFAGKAVGRPLTITLVTGGRRYPLNVDAQAFAYRGVRNATPSGAVWVAVRGTATDSRVEIGYDGVVQRVDPATRTIEKGRAALLYAASPGTEVDLSARVGGPLRLVERERPEGTVTARRTAYVEGLGWAPSGRAWLVSTMALDLLFPVTRSGGDYFANRPGTLTYRYAGKPVIPAAVGVAPPPDFGTFSRGNPRESFVADVAARPGAAKSLVATVRTTAMHETDEGSAGSTISVTLTFTAAVP